MGKQDIKKKIAKQVKIMSHHEGRVIITSCQVRMIQTIRALSFDGKIFEARWNLL